MRFGYYTLEGIQRVLQITELPSSTLHLHIVGLTRKNLKTCYKIKPLPRLRSFKRLFSIILFYISGNFEKKIKLFIMQNYGFCLK